LYVYRYLNSEFTIQNSLQHAQFYAYRYLNSEFTIQNCLQHAQLYAYRYLNSDFTIQNCLQHAQFYVYRYLKSEFKIQNIKSLCRVLMCPVHESAVHISNKILRNHITIFGARSSATKSSSLLFRDTQKFPQLHERIKIPDHLSLSTDSCKWLRE
jgi:hypothetical protein